VSIGRKSIWPRRPAAAWISALFALAAAIALRWLLDPVLADSLPFVTLFGAVAAAVWLAGDMAGIVVALGGYAAANYLFIPPRGGLQLATSEQVIGLVAYLFTCAIIIALGEAMRRARSKASTRLDVLRVTLASIGDAVITTDVQGRVTYLNSVAESLTGWQADRAQGEQLHTVFDIVNETTGATVESPAVRALREGVVVGLANHTVLRRRDGSQVPIDDSAAPIRDERGEVSGCVLIFRDVTQQRRFARDRETQLHAARTLAAIVDSSEAGIVSKSLDGVIQSWNAAAERLFGYSASQAIGKHISLVIPPERIHEEDEIVARLRAGQRIDHLETERVRADGGRVLVSLTISPIRDDAGNVIGASKIARDITHEKRLERELRQLANDLAAADRRKNEFLATLSHELRGPLAPLANSLEITKRAKDASALDRAHKTMERQLAQLVRLVDDLLDLSRITYDRLELRRAPADLAQIVDQAAETIRPSTESLGQELRVALPEAPLWVDVDPARIAQVLGNLLNNASKYTDPGGRISIAARREGDDAVVVVADSGAGIPPDSLDSVFEIFARLDHSQQRDPGGLGIGLSLVKRLVELHGGTVEARSAGLGKGSEFVVRLPATLAAPTLVGDADAGTKAVARRLRILIVDDNVDSAESLATLLGMEGHETRTANDGLAAIEAAESLQPDVMLLDIGLPRLDGYDVCRRIRGLAWGKHVTIVAVTGWGHGDDREKSRAAGFDGHLVKPVRYDALTELLASIGSPSSAESTS